MDNRTETSLALDNGIWDAHLLAKGWEEDDELNWVDVVWNEDERGLLVLDQTNNVVQSILDGVWLLADILLLLSLLDGSGLLEKTLLLLGLGLWAVLVEELEGLGGSVAVEDVLELSNGRWDLQSEVEDLALTLETDILWPSNHACYLLMSGGKNYEDDTYETGCGLAEHLDRFRSYACETR